MGEQDQKCILVIEDNIAFLKMLKMRLESNGYRTLASQNGLEGLNLVRQEKPDLIICDLMLPGLDGHKITRMIKFDKNIQHIPMIMLTSRDLDEDMKLARKCGADAFVIKTEKPEVLINQIKELLQKSSSKSVIETVSFPEMQHAE